MRLPVWFACLATILAQDPAGTTLPREVLLMAKTRLRVDQILKNQPNYTCSQFIERSRRRAGSQKWELIDTLRLEVAYVNGQELFSWPGARKFEDRDLTDMVGGTIGNGDFAIFTKVVFLGSATLVYDGEEERDGRRLIRFRYHVARLNSGYRLRVGEAQGIAGYEGRAWVDQRTFDPVRLEVHANDIPLNVPLRDVNNWVEYAPVEIGGASHVLPSTSEIVLTDFQGGENRNRATFSQCRQYGAHSELTFADPAENPAEAKAPTALELDPGAELEMKLTSRIDSRQNAVGDAFTAEITRPVRLKGGEVLVPKGARIEGRISHLQFQQGSLSFWILGLRLERLTFADKVSDLKVHLLFPRRIDRRAPLSGVRGAGPEVELRGYRDPNLIVFYGTSQLDLRPGFPMTWITE